MRFPKAAKAVTVILGLLLILSACGPLPNDGAVIREELESQIADLQETVNLQSDAVKESLEFGYALQTQVAELEADKIVLGEALEAYQVTPTPVATEVNIEPAGDECPPTDFFDALNVGYVPQLATGHKSTAVSASIGCAVASFTFGDGSYVTGQMSNDGTSLVTCAYVDDGGTRFDCSQFKVRTWGEYKVEARIHKKAGGFLGYICLAEHTKAYTDNCD